MSEKKRVQPSRKCKIDENLLVEEKSPSPSDEKKTDFTFRDWLRTLPELTEHQKLHQKCWNRVNASEASEWQLYDMARHGFIPKVRLDECIKDTPLSSSNDGGVCNVCAEPGACCKCIVCGKYICYRKYGNTWRCIDKCGDRCGEYCTSCHHSCWGC